MGNKFLKKILFIVILSTISLTITLSAPAQDVEGSKDHQLISRYPGSKITQYKVKGFDEIEIPMGKAKTEPWGVLGKSQRVEGKITMIWYWLPENRSVLEVYRNYEQALSKAGFTTLFSCKTFQECGPLQNYFHQPFEAGTWASEERQLSAKLARPEGDVYVALRVEEGGAILFIVETKPMESGLVTVDAAAMAGDITRTGHVAIYGILFDFNKADVKPESEPALKEIAKLLKQDPKLKLHVVGHTDNVGDLKFNMDLSRRRANAVIKELTTKHGIAAARLRADGVGPLSPVASNKTDEGRAKNRRVELVEQ